MIGKTVGEVDDDDDDDNERIGHFWESVMTTIKIRIFFLRPTIKIRIEKRSCQLAIK